MPFSFLECQPETDDDGFYATDIPAGEVTANSMHTANAGRQTAIITRAGGRLVAFSNTCPHAATDLSKGRLSKGQIKCPDHGYTFDVRTGRATWPPDEGCHLTRFAVKEEDGLVKIRPLP